MTEHANYKENIDGYLDSMFEESKLDNISKEISNLTKNNSNEKYEHLKKDGKTKS